MEKIIDREINKFCDTRQQICECNGKDCFFTSVKIKEEYLSSSKKNKLRNKLKPN